MARRLAWSTAVCSALARAERITALLLAKFYADIDRQLQPLQVRIVFGSAEMPVANALLFVREASASHHDNWAVHVADTNGQVTLCAELAHQYDLLPAMAGYMFEGRHYGDYAEGEFLANTSPVRYVHRALANDRPPTMFLVLRQSAQPAAATPIWHEGRIPVQTAWHRAVPIGKLAAMTGPYRDDVKRRVDDAVEQQMDVAAFGKGSGDSPYLTPEVDVFLRIALGCIVDVERGDFAQSREALAQNFEKLKHRPNSPPAAPSNPGASKKPRAWSVPMREAWGRLPLTKLRLANGQVRAVRQLTLCGSAAGEIATTKPATVLPAAAGATVAIEVVRGPGCVGTTVSLPARVVTSTGKDGVAWVRVRAGSERGVLRLKITALQVPHLPPDLLPLPRVLDLVVYPARDGSPDTSPVRPPRLEALSSSPERLQAWPHIRATLVHP